MHIARSRTSLILTAALLAAGCAREPELLHPAIGQLLRETVEVEAVPAAIRDQPERAQAWQDLQRFYKLRLYTPAWFDAGGPLPQAEELIAALEPLSREGLDPGRYQTQRLQAMLEAARQEGSLDDREVQRRLVDLDLNLTYTFMTAAAHMATGRLQPSTLDVEWYTKPRSVDLDGLLDEALGEEGEEGGIAAALAELAPPQEAYGHLRDALARHREIAGRGGWPAVPDGPPLAAGATGERVRALRARLAASGDLAAAPATPEDPGFDAELASAVRRFQRRHGIEETGAVDEATLAALNVPLERRIEEIEVNLERWRWLPSDLGQRYILVNVPDFTMQLVEGGREAMAMRVIVGKEQSRTPVFSGKMTYVVMNPAWNLPDSIVRDEVLPALAKDRGYLARKNMEVVRGWGDDAPVLDASEIDWSELGQPGSEYRVRQRPGSDNPLGKIKFMFPNQHDIYLHDTPADHLFDRAERDFSHGCIRLEKPVELAAYLLRGDPKWTAEAIAEKLASGEPATASLPKPIAVHLQYWTAWAEPDGTVQFRKDVYDHDQTLAAALAKEPPVTLDLPALRGEVTARVEEDDGAGS